MITALGSGITALGSGSAPVFIGSGIRLIAECIYWILDFFFFASRTVYYMLLALSSDLACHEVVENVLFSGIRFHNCLCCLVCALDNIINL